jgi:hypothetical protein
MNNEKPKKRGFFRELLDSFKEGIEEAKQELAVEEQIAKEYIAGILSTGVIRGSHLPPLLWTETVPWR